MKQSMRLTRRQGIEGCKSVQGRIKILREGDFKLRSGMSGFRGGTVVKNLPANAGDTGLSPVQEDPTSRGATKLVRHNY